LRIETLFYYKTTILKIFIKLNKNYLIILNHTEKKVDEQANAGARHQKKLKALTESKRGASSSEK